jgi:uncharacterized protein with FMN-binding domain
MWKRPAIATVLTAAALVLLLSFKTPQAAPSISNGGNVVNAAGVAQQAVGTTGTGTGSGATAGAGATAHAKSTYSGQLTGSAIDIGYGIVQVQVTFQNGAITDVQTVQMPGGGHSGQVSSYAAPQLRSEALAAQSAQINTVSGATYTSSGYIQSLQSALDQMPA